MTHLIDGAVLALLVVTALLIIRTRGLFPAVMLTGIYSFLGASWMTLLDAPDVAFTEAAVGAGIATILMLGTLARTTAEEVKPTRPTLVPLLVVLATGAALFFGTADMPTVGDPSAPANRYPSPSYVERTAEEIHVPNVVTAVLASYRGYDTLGETTVIFTAGVGVLLILRRPRSRPARKDPP